LNTDSDRVGEAAKERHQGARPDYYLCQDLMSHTQTKKAPEAIDVDAIQVKLEETAADLNQRNEKSSKVTTSCSSEPAA